LSLIALIKSVKSVAIFYLPIILLPSPMISPPFVVHNILHCKVNNYVLRVPRTKAVG